MTFKKFKKLKNYSIAKIEVISIYRNYMALEDIRDIIVGIEGFDLESLDQDVLIKGKNSSHFSR